MSVVECSLCIIVQLLTCFQHAVHIPNHNNELPVALVQDGWEDLLDILAVCDEADYQDDFDEVQVEPSAFDSNPLE